LARWKTSNLYRSSPNLGFKTKKVKLRFREKTNRPEGVTEDKFLLFNSACSKLQAMTEPLALVLYDRLLPGSQLVNRLQDLRYRVQALNDAERLVECAEQAKPLVIVADLDSTRNNVCAAISRLRANPATRHLPVIGFCRESTPELAEAGRAAGVSLLTTDTAILSHLAQLLQQALAVE
jgi:CheY-like chemotaxis protein